MQTVCEPISALQRQIRKSAEGYICVRAGHYLCWHRTNNNSDGVLKARDAGLPRISNIPILSSCRSAQPAIFIHLHVRRMFDKFSDESSTNSFTLNFVRYMPQEERGTRGESTMENLLTPLVFLANSTLFSYYIWV